MAIYEYLCDQDGEFEVMRRLGTALETEPCPSCGKQARRVFSMPMLRSASRSGWNAAIDHAEKSRFEPEVVSSLPPSGARRPSVQMTPALRSLPRP